MVLLENFTQPGENAATAGNPIELFLEKFGGEVARAYAQNLVLAPRIRVKTLTKGKSFTFGATGKMTASYHLRAGDKNLALNELEVGERLIHLDRPITSDTFTDEWEEMANHWDIRGPIAEEMGQAIAELVEGNLMNLIIRGAGTAGPVTGQPAGLVTISLDADTIAADLIVTIEDQVQYWNENSVPQGGRIMLVRPAQFRLLAQQTEFHDQTLGNNGNGSLKEGTVGRMKGVDILQSNLIPTTDTSALVPDYAINGQVNDYGSDALNTVALFTTGRALGMVQAKGLRMSMDTQERYGGTFFYGSRTVGANILRESDCGVVNTV